MVSGGMASLACTPHTFHGLDVDIHVHVDMHIDIHLHVDVHIDKMYMYMHIHV